MPTPKKHFKISNSISFGKATRFPTEKASNNINSFLLLPSTLKERKCGFGYGKREIFSKFILNNALINPAPNSYFKEEDQSSNPNPFLPNSERNNTNINETDNNPTINRSSHRSEGREKNSFYDQKNEENQGKPLKNANKKSIKFSDNQNFEINDNNNSLDDKKHEEKMTNHLKNGISKSIVVDKNCEEKEKNSIKNNKYIDLINENSMLNNEKQSITNFHKKGGELMKKSNLIQDAKKSEHNDFPNFRQTRNHPGKSFGLSYFYYKKNYIPFDSHPNIYLHEHFPGPGKYNDSPSNSKKILMKIKTDNKNFIDWEILNYKSPKQFYDCNETKLFGNKRFCKISFGKGKKTDFTVTPCREFPGPADYDPGKFKCNDSPSTSKKNCMKIKTDIPNLNNCEIFNNKSPKQFSKGGK